MSNLSSLGCIFICLYNGCNCNVFSIAIDAKTIYCIDCRSAHRYSPALNQWIRIATKEDIESDKDDKEEETI